MSKLYKAVIKVFRDMLLGFRISQELKNKSNWGKL
jgi:hypothetical protein